MDGFSLVRLFAAADFCLSSFFPWFSFGWRLECLSISKMTFMGVLKPTTWLKLYKSELELEAEAFLLERKHRKKFSLKNKWKNVWRNRQTFPFPKSFFVLSFPLSSLTHSRYSCHFLPFFNRTECRTVLNGTSPLMSKNFRYVFIFCSKFDQKEQKAIRNRNGNKAKTFFCQCALCVCVCFYCWYCV